MSTEAQRNAANGSGNMFTMSADLSEISPVAPIARNGYAPFAKSTPGTLVSTDPIVAPSVNGWIVMPSVSSVLSDETLSYAVGADKQKVSAGDLILANEEAVRYRIALASATDAHVSTVGGVKLYVLRDADGLLSAKGFGIDGTGTIDVTSKLQAFVALGGKLALQRGATYLISDTILIPSDTDLDLNRSKTVSHATAFVMSTPNNPAMYAPDRISTIAGTLRNYRASIRNGYLSVGCQRFMAGVYIGACEDFLCEDIRADVNPLSSGGAVHVVVNHAAKNTVIRRCDLRYEGTYTIDKGACAATRNSAWAGPVENTLWDSCYFYKNSNSTDEIYWVNGASGITTGTRHINCKYESGPDDVGPSDVTCYNFDTNNPGIYVADATWQNCTFKSRGAINKHAFIFGYPTDSLDLKRCSISNCTFDIDKNLAIYHFTSAIGAIVQDSVCYSNGGRFWTVSSTVQGAVSTQNTRIKNCRLFGTYSTAILGVSSVEDTWCEDCLTFVDRCLSVRGNTVDLCRLNFAVLLGTSNNIRIERNKVNIGGYTSGSVRATFYVTSRGKQVIRDNVITYLDDNSWITLYGRNADNGSALTVFEGNDLQLAGTATVKPSFQTFFWSLGGFRRNYLYDRWSDGVGSKTSFGVSGLYVPKGHQVDYDDFTIGASQVIGKRLVGYTNEGAAGVSQTWANITATTT